MKTLSELTNNSYSELEKHIITELSLANKINEFKFNDYITEDKFVYDGQVDLSIFLAKEIIAKCSLYSLSVNKSQKSLLTYTNKDLNKFKNIFFKTITIKYNDSITTGYVNDVQFDKTTRLFKNIVIQINSDEYSSLKDLSCYICHELTHAWRDYNCELKDKSVKLLDICRQGTRYKETITYKSNEPIQNIQQLKSKQQ